jgi:hypothetical protein
VCNQLSGGAGSTLLGGTVFLVTFLQRSTESLQKDWGPCRACLSRVPLLFNRQGGVWSADPRGNVSYQLSKFVTLLEDRRSSVGYKSIRTQ